MVVVPVDAEKNEAQHIAQEDRDERGSAAASVPYGTFNSSTMIVIRMAITPSLNASIRLLLIDPSA